eukprot:5617918-Pleurochrysis_carterae.AAC.2
MASMRGPQVSGNKDNLAGASLCRSRQAKTRRLCARRRKRSRIALASALGGGQKEASAVAGVHADVVAAKDSASADAAPESWLKCASDATATFRGVVSKCAAYEAECQVSCRVTPQLYSRR